MKNLPAVIDQHKPEMGTSIRIDCPFCGGSNTLSITNDGTKILWNCFKASCKAKGVSEASYSKEAIAILFNKLKDRKEEEEIQEFKIPETFKEPFTCNDAVEYARKNNIWYATTQGLAKCRYDVALHRFVFLIKQGDKVVNAVGRSLHKKNVVDGFKDIIGIPANKTTKWFIYGDNLDVPFLVGTTGSIVIVEDCASAAAVASSGSYSGCAILGTNLKQEHINFLLTKHPTEVIIALDKDATTKSIEYVRELYPYFKKVSMLVLEDDLKYYSGWQIKNIIDTSKEIITTHDRKEIITVTPTERIIQ